MGKLYKLKDKLFDEMNKLSSEISGKPGLNTGDPEYAHMLTDTVRNIDKICMLEEEAGYSEDDSYGDGSSYANRGKHIVRRHYSRDDGRSEMMEHLEMALDSVGEQDRETIKRFMSQMENA